MDGEELTTLDGNVRKLTENMLVIADDTRAVGLAGIMGGENSEIVADTVDIADHPGGIPGAQQPVRGFHVQQLHQVPLAAALDHGLMEPQGRAL